MRKIEISKDLLFELYIKQGLTLKAVAGELGVNRQTIANKLKEFNIPIANRNLIKPIQKLKIKKKVDYRCKEAFLKVYTELKSIVLVAEYFDINVSTAFDWKLKHNIQTISGVSDKAKAKRIEGKPYTNKEYLAKMYMQYSTYDLAKMWNCSDSTISKWLKRFNIPTRSVAEQWNHKAKNGVQVITQDEFDLQLYNSNYSDSEHLSKRVVLKIKEAVSKCQSCGQGEVLDLHHINENRKDNRPENHIILCPNCHAKIHRLGYTVEDLCPNFKSWDKLINAEAK